MSTDKLIMVIAGSVWQIPIVQKIRSMGHKSLVVNLYENSPAFVYADFFEIADILDKEQCLAIAKRYNIDAVISDECDIAMPTVAFIAEQLYLYSLGSKYAALYTNKLLMREFCKEHSFPYPPYSLCKNIAEAITFFEVNNQEKIIIKPLDSNSSRGVYTITSIDDLNVYFEASLSYSKTEKAVIAEKYIDGIEFTVDGIKIRDKHYSLAISKKEHYDYNENIANQLFFSSYDDEYDYDELRRVNNAFIELSGLPDGILTHSEYKFENGKFYLIETAARGGGNLISSDIVPLLSGFDNYEYLINKTLNLPSTPKEIINPVFKERCAVLYFFDAPDESGTVKQINGLDYLNDSPNVLNYKLNFKTGDTINKAVNDSERVGFYIAYAEHRNELIAIMEKINNNFKIEII